MPLRTIWRLLIKHKKGLYHSNYSQDKRDYTCLRKHRFNLVTKPRQAGVSTTTAAYMSIKLVGQMLNPEAVLIIANKQTCF
jgi:hypothetical protein